MDRSEEKGRKIKKITGVRRETNGRGWRAFTDEYRKEKIRICYVATGMLEV